MSETFVGGALRRLVEPDPARSGARFEAFYDAEYRRVVGLAFALSGNRHTAEDIAQEAFTAVYRDWSRVSHLEQPGAWVRRVVSNLAVSSFRRRMVETKALMRLSGRRETTITMLPDGDAEFWDAVRSLPKRQAQAVALHYLEDYSVAEIANVLEMAEGTVKAHLHAARKSLAKRLQIDEGSAEVSA